MDRSRNLVARTITVLNLKGGVGKTHSAWLLASVAQEVGMRILVVDLDAQGNLTSSFLSQPDGRPGAEALFDPAAETSASALVRTTQFPHIDLIPASPSLARFDLADQRVWEKADLQLTLQDALAELRPRYEFIVLDCPPRLSLVSYAALCASDGVIIPMEAADWGAQGIMQVTGAIEHVRKHENSRLRLLGYLVSRFKRPRLYQQSYLTSLREHFGDLAFDTVIPDLAAYEKSVTDRIPITRHAPRSEAAHIARRFFAEVCRRAQGIEGGSRARGKAGVRRSAAVAPQ